MQKVVLIITMRHEKFLVFFVLWHSDNANTAKIITNGSAKDSLQELVLDVFEICMKNDIRIISNWIPREENEFADYISKHLDTDDWGVDWEAFHFIQHEFGSFDVTDSQIQTT